MEMNPLTKRSSLNTLWFYVPLPRCPRLSQWMLQGMKSSLGRRPPIYTCSLGEARGFKQTQRLLLRWATGFVIWWEQPWSSLISCFQEMLVNMGQVATPLGLGFTLYMLNIGSKESQNNSQGYGKKTQGHSAITKILDPAGFQNQNFWGFRKIICYL